jgi:hypothetical protein
LAIVFYRKGEGGKMGEKNDERRGKINLKIIREKRRKNINVWKLM